MRHALYALAVVAALASAEVRAEPGRITVIGHATIEMAPDYASVQVGIASRGPNPAAALDANSAAAERVIAIAKEFGIEPADLGTSSVNLTQVFKSVRGAGGTTEQADGYRAENDLRIRLRDFARLGDIMRKVLDGGANAIDGVTFGLSDPRLAERRAGEDAVRDATARARALAEAAGVKLATIESIVSPPRSARSSAVPGQMSRAVAAAPAKRVPLEAGTIEVSSEVEVTWTLAQP